MTSFLHPALLFAQASDLQLASFQPDQVNWYVTAIKKEDSTDPPTYNDAPITEQILLQENAICKTNGGWLEIQARLTLPERRISPQLTTRLGPNATAIVEPPIEDPADREVRPYKTLTVSGHCYSFLSPPVPSALDKVPTSGVLTVHRKDCTYALGLQSYTDGLEPNQGSWYYTTVYPTLVYTYANDPENPTTFTIPAGRKAFIPDPFTPGSVIDPVRLTPEDILIMADHANPNDWTLLPPSS